MPEIDIHAARSENEEEYDAVLAGEEGEIRGAILNDPLRSIDPAEPLLCKKGESVRDAIRKIKESPQHHGAVCVVGDDGKLLGIFSERDIMNRVVGMDLDVNEVKVGDVMTPNPIALSADDKIADALHYMAVRGFRNIPIVKGGRPIGIVFTRHFVKFIVSLFPERTLNRSVGVIKNPEVMHGG